MRVDSVKESRWEAEMRFSIAELPKLTTCFCFSANNPYIEIYRGVAVDLEGQMTEEQRLDSVQNLQFFKVYKSDPVMNS